MFDIRIGTIIPADAAPAMMRELNKKGFESYELDFNGKLPRLFDGMEKLAQEILDAADGRPVSALGYYGNPLLDSAFRENLKELIRKAKLFHCPVVSTFAGGDPSKSVPDTIPLSRFTKFSGKKRRNVVKSHFMEASRISISRLVGWAVISAAFSIRSSVVSPCADTTTTTSLPFL